MSERGTTHRHRRRERERWRERDVEESRERIDRIGKKSKRCRVKIDGRGEKRV